jgi:hypothetical protein
VLRLEVIKRSFDSHPSATIEAQDVFVWRMAVVGTKNALAKTCPVVQGGRKPRKISMRIIPKPKQCKGSNGQAVQRLGPFAIRCRRKSRNSQIN